MVAAMKKLIAQVEALPEAEQAEVAELLLAALRSEPPQGELAVKA